MDDEQPEGENLDDCLLRLIERAKKTRALIVELQQYGPLTESERQTVDELSKTFSNLKATLSEIGAELKSAPLGGGDTSVNPPAPNPDGTPK